jgi:hypothetical protein
MASDILANENEWVCIDCLVYHANGDLPESEMEASELLHDITKNLDGYRLTLGHTRELHACKTNYTVTPLYRVPQVMGAIDHEYLGGDPIEVYADTVCDAIERAESMCTDHDRIGWRVVAHDLTTAPEQGGECECEVIAFASKDCASCDRNIAGEWHAATLWKVVE